MAEIGAAEHVGKIFAQAQRLMVAKQTLVTAKLEAEAAERELERLNNGSTTIRLDDYEGNRYFACEGPAVLAVLEDKRLEAGGAPSNAVPAICQSVVGYSSWEMDRGAQRPKEAPVCHTCELAIDRAKPKPKPEATEASPKSTAAIEMANASLDEEPSF